MKRTLLGILFLVVASWPGWSNPSAIEGDLTITLVGNAGFILSVGALRVGIDAIFTYQIPGETRARMAQAQEPFDLDIILVTHDHSDHVHAETVAQNLTAHPEARLIAPASVITAILESAPGLEPDRLLALTWESQAPFLWDREGLRVEAFSFPHPPNGQPPNAGFRLHLGEFTVYHTGDLDVETAAEDFTRYGFPENPVDLAFVPYFQLSPPYASALAYLPARVYVPMHLRAGAWGSTCASLSQVHENLLCFEHPMEIRTLPAP